MPQVKVPWRLVHLYSLITKTRLHNFDPLKPHFYIVKLGFIGVYIIFLTSVQNIDCRYSLEPPRRGGSNEYPQSIFWAEMWKLSGFFIWKFSIFMVVKFSIYLNRRVFVMIAVVLNTAYELLSRRKECSLTHPINQDLHCYSCSQNF